LRPVSTHTNIPSPVLDSLRVVVAEEAVLDSLLVDSLLVAEEEAGGM
jgi:hypothetical protein